MLSMYTYYKLKNKASQGELFLGGGVCQQFSIEEPIPLLECCSLFRPVCYRRDERLICVPCIYLMRCRLVNWLSNLYVVLSPGRTRLLVVGVSCFLCFATSLTQLPDVGPHKEIISSGFRSRSLLSTSSTSSITVSPVYLLNWFEEHFFFVCVCKVASPPLFLQPFTTKEIIGFCIGSVSSVLYLCSRGPQIYTNVSMTKYGLV